MIFNYDVFCKNIKKLRELKGLNKFEMSIQANIQYSYYVNIENGKKIPNLKNVISIANALNTDIATLLISDDNIYNDKYLKDKIKQTIEMCSNTDLIQIYLEILVWLRKRMENKNDGL